VIFGEHGAAIEEDLDAGDRGYGEVVRVGLVGGVLEVDGEAGGLFGAVSFFGRLAGREDGDAEQEGEEQIGIERGPASTHIAAYTKGLGAESKESMSKQYNKAEKRQRRLKWIKRKRVAAKVKGKGAKESKAPAAQA
jgi:hypothetical protein